MSTRKLTELKVHLIEADAPTESKSSGEATGLPDAISRFQGLATSQTRLPFPHQVLQLSDVLINAQFKRYDGKEEETDSDRNPEQCGEVSIKQNRQRFLEARLGPKKVAVRDVRFVLSEFQQDRVKIVDLITPVHVLLEKYESMAEALYLYSVYFPNRNLLQDQDEMLNDLDSPHMALAMSLTRVVSDSTVTLAWSSELESAVMIGFGSIVVSSVPGPLSSLGDVKVFFPVELAYCSQFHNPLRLSEKPGLLTKPQLINLLARVGFNNMNHVWSVAGSSSSVSSKTRTRFIWNVLQ
jgi:hypothetical protein